MPTIRQLPPGLVNKIAAGEVIERPASVVKELLENSVDAGATNIEVAIEGGGLELIRISDNGCGIEAAQIPLALASHATSKLQTAEDLFDVHTLGFRGEALASIAEVSHVTLRSRTAASDAGAEISVRGGEATDIVPSGCPVGTILEIRHLFFNTPVRRKFLRTPQTEAGHITEAFTRIALAFPDIKFTLRSGNRVVYELPATDAWQERIRAFFGDEIADALIEVESEQPQARLTGFVADPSISRGNNRMQYIFLNGRHIRDRSLQHALSEAYRGLLMVGRFPVCFLRLYLPPDQVDVNVHPTKMEVRFQEGGKLYSQLLKTLRHEFLTTDLTARVRHTPGPLPQGLQTNSAELPGEMPPIAHGDQRWQAHAERVAAAPSMAEARIAAAPVQLDLRDLPPPFRPFPDSRGNPLRTTQDGSELPRRGGASELESPREDIPHVPNSAGTGLNATRIDGPHSNDTFRVPASAEEAPSRFGFQVHNRYLITQDESGMVIVDQHALHERILYEQLRQKTEARTLESQQLLVPEPLDLTPSEASAALEFKEVLARIGIDVEPFGGDTVLMTSYPAMLAKMRPAEVLRQVLEPLMSGGKQPDARDLLDELLHMLACKAAIKAGDRLSSDEISALLEQRDHYQDTHHCPHGRPTALFFSREQLDRMFKRT